jgi:ankyrin repeat protein
VLEIVRLLINHGADVTAQDMTCSTPLQLASYSGILEVVQILLENGSGVNARNETHSTPLHRASLLGCVESVQVLINHGADVNAQDWTDKTPLHLASSWVSAKTFHSGSSLGLMAKDSFILRVPWRTD